MPFVLQVCFDNYLHAHECFIIVKVYITQGADLLDGFNDTSTKNVIYPNL